MVEQVFLRRRLKRLREELGEWWQISGARYRTYQRAVRAALPSRRAPRRSRAPKLLPPRSLSFFKRRIETN